MQRAKKKAHVTKYEDLWCYSAVSATVGSIGYTYNWAQVIPDSINVIVNSECF